MLLKYYAIFYILHDLITYSEALSSKTTWYPVVKPCIFHQIGHSSQNLLFFTVHHADNQRSWEPIQFAIFFKRRFCIS
jgi:hypothetical protein